jgi:hypothetical protein
MAAAETPFKPADPSPRLGRFQQINAKAEPGRKDSYKVARQFSFWYNMKRMRLSTPECFISPWPSVAHPSRSDDQRPPADR